MGRAPDAHTVISKPDIPPGISGREPFSSVSRRGELPPGKIGILCIANDAGLLQTRRMLLEWAGYRPVARTPAEVSASSRIPPCELAIICHSVAGRERREVIGKLHQSQSLRWIVALDRSEDAEVESDPRVSICSSRPEALLRCIFDLVHSKSE